MYSSLPCLLRAMTRSARTHCPTSDTPIWPLQYRLSHATCTQSRFHYLQNLSTVWNIGTQTAPGYHAALTVLSRGIAKYIFAFLGQSHRNSIPPAIIFRPQDALPYARSRTIPKYVYTLSRTLLPSSILVPGSPRAETASPPQRKRAGPIARRRFDTGCRYM